MEVIFTILDKMKKKNGVKDLESALVEMADAGIRKYLGFPLEVWFEVLKGEENEYRDDA